MKHINVYFVLAVFTFCVSNGNIQAREKDKLYLDINFQIYRFSGNIPSDIDEDKKIWTTKKIPDDVKYYVNVFDRAEFMIGNSKFEINKKGCFLDEEMVPVKGVNQLNVPEDKFKLIYSPSIHMPDRSKSAVKINSEQPIPYFEKNKDGYFELKEIVMPTGMDIEVWANHDKGIVDMTDIVLKIRSVQEREPLEGVNLPVGKPILSEQEYRFSLNIEPERDYGILIRPEFKQGGFLIRFRCSLDWDHQQREERKKDNGEITAK